MNIALACGKFDLQAELIVEKLNEPVETVNRKDVALIDERVATIDHAHFRVGFLQWGQEGIVQP